MKRQTAMDFHDLEPLLTAIANGWGTPEEIARVDAALREDETLRAQAAAWYCDEALLHQEATLLDALVGNPPVYELTAGLRSEPISMPARIGRTRARSRWLPTLAIAALACALLLSVTAWLGSRSNMIDVSATADGVRLTKATGCVWDVAEGAVPPRLGNALKGGDRLRLVEGIAELQFALNEAICNARLQGPVSAVLQSDGMPLLISGRMVMDVRVFNGTCSIETPVGTIELTENASFGMTVQEGVLEIHVFDGSVPLPFSRLRSQLASESRHFVSEGEAVIVHSPLAATPNIERRAADAELFAEERSMSTDRLDLGRGYAEQVLASKPVSYWRFAEITNDSFQNEVKDGLLLLLGGDVATVVQGRNRVIEFGMTRRSGYLYTEDMWPQQPLGEFSLEVWVKPSHFHNSAVFGLVSWDKADTHRERHAMLLELGGPERLFDTSALPNSLRYLLRDPPSGIPDFEFGSSIQNVYQVRRWQHIAYVKHSDQLKLYFNGKQIASEECQGVLTAGQRLVCGSLYFHRVARPFVGQLDELALYDRALSNKEVESHYRTGIMSEVDADSI
jgi:hypothetical protein